MLFHRKLATAIGIMASKNSVLESLKTDFFDAYLLTSSPYRSEPDVIALLDDRVDRLFNHLKDRLYWILADRAYTSGILRKPDRVMELLKVVGDNKRRSIINKLISMDYDHEAYFDSWSGIVAMWRKMTHSPNNPIARMRLLDELFGMSHNGGPLIEYLGLPWLFDALYVRALGDANELAARSSIEAKEAARSAEFGVGRRPVSDSDKRALYLAKKERSGGKSIAPAQNVVWLSNGD